MTDAAAAVTTGEVTQAVRDTKSDIGDIAEGDWIGIVRGDGIAACNVDQLTAITSLLEVIVTADAEIVTVITGSDADAGITASIEAWLGEHRPAAAAEVHAGGQPLYPYLFGVE